MLSVWGVLISFWSISVFSHPPLPFIIIIVFVVVTIIGYYCYYLSPQSSWLCVMGALVGAGYGGWGLWLGCEYGRFLGCS